MHLFILKHINQVNPEERHSHCHGFDVVIIAYFLKMVDKELYVFLSELFLDMKARNLRFNFVWWGIRINFSHESAHPFLHFLFLGFPLRTFHEQNLKERHHLDFTDIIEFLEKVRNFTQIKEHLYYRQSLHDGIWILFRICLVQFGFKLNRVLKILRGWEPESKT